MSAPSTHRSPAGTPEEWLIEACRRAASASAGRHLHHADPEHLALLAAGRLDEIPEHERPALLDAVAADPDLAALVADLSVPGALEGAFDDAIPLRDRRWASPRPWRIALAACGLLAAALLLWRLADPPGPARSSESIQLLGQDRPADPVDAAAAANASWSRGDLLRDAALLGLLVACGVLAWPALRDFDRPPLQQ